MNLGKTGADSDAFSAVEICAIRAEDWPQELAAHFPSCDTATAAVLIEESVAPLGATHRQIALEILESGEFRLLLRLPIRDNAPQVDTADGRDTTTAVGVRLRLSLQLVDLKAASDFFVGSFLREIELFQVNQPILVFSNPSAEHVLQVSVRLFTRLLPWLIFAIVSELAFGVVCVALYRILVLRWTQQLSQVSGHRTR